MYMNGMIVVLIVCLMGMLGCTIATIIESKKQNKLGIIRAGKLSDLYVDIENKKFTTNFEQIKSGHIFLDLYEDGSLKEIFVVDYDARKEEYILLVYRATWDDKKKEKYAKRYIKLTGLEVNDILWYLEQQYGSNE